ncbi:MAG TPA: hypothetical protein VGL38_06305 [bacterium]|jgi:hypothetical protein
MMKKVMFVLVSLLVVSSFAFALESGPSNKVGYVKIQCNGGTSAVYTAFGLPFKFWTVPTGNVPTYGTESRKPSSIVGTQTNCGTSLTADRIVRQDVGRFAYRNSASSCTWAGQLETNPADMEPGRAYWYRNNSGAVRNLVLAGEADTTGIGIPTVTITAPTTQPLIPTPYSWRDPRDVPRERLNLLAQGFTGGTSLTSDKVLAQVGGAAFTYNTSTNLWSGGLTVVSPGVAYWIQNKHSGHTWNYTYNASGVPLTMPDGNTISTMKISTHKVAPVAKNTVKAGN